jgi:hypothetical protein
LVVLEFHVFHRIDHCFELGGVHFSKHGDLSEKIGGF